MGLLERCPGLTLILDLSYLQERFAKTVTNNLPLLSVLGFRCNFVYRQDESFFVQIDEISVF